MSREGVAETLLRISKLKKKEDKIAQLRVSHNIALETVVDLCFNENVVFDLPEGVPPYKENPKELDLQGALFSNLRKFGIFVKGGAYKDLKPIKREVLFIQFLESLDPDDAKLVASIKDKKMPYKGITRELFNEAWPSLASTWAKK